MRVLDTLTYTLSIIFWYLENCSFLQRCWIKQFLPQTEFKKNHNHFLKFTARCRWLVSFVSWQFEIFVFTGQDTGGLYGWLGHGGKEESPVSWWNKKPWTSSSQPVSCCKQVKLPRVFAYQRCNWVWFVWGTAARLWRCDNSWTR